MSDQRPLNEQVKEGKISGRLLTDQHNLIACFWPRVLFSGDFHGKMYRSTFNATFITVFLMGFVYYFVMQKGSLSDDLINWLRFAVISAICLANFVRYESRVPMGHYNFHPRAWVLFPVSFLIIFLGMQLAFAIQERLSTHLLSFKNLLLLLVHSYAWCVVATNLSRIFMFRKNWGSK